MVEPPEGRVAFSAPRPELEEEEAVEDPEDVEGLEEDVAMVEEVMGVAEQSM